MTNYINSIELDGTVYTVGPLKVDDYDNIVSHSVQLGSRFSNNIVIGSSSISCSDNLANSSIYSNIIIGNPSVSLTTSYNNIIVGSGDTYVHAHNDSTSKFIKLAAGNVSAGISSGNVWVGPLSVQYAHFNNSGYVVPRMVGPVDIYAVGTCTIELGALDPYTWTGTVHGYNHAELNVSIDPTYDTVSYYYTIDTNSEACWANGTDYYDKTGGYANGCPTVGFSASDSKIYFAVGYQSWMATSFDIDIYVYARTISF